MIAKPMTMLLAMLAGWINREQQQIIEYLKAENSILKEELLRATGKKRIILNDTQRRRLAILGQKLGRKLLGQICCAFSPDTLLKWHRMFSPSDVTILNYLNCLIKAPHTPEDAFPSALCTSVQHLLDTICVQSIPGDSLFLCKRWFIIILFYIFSHRIPYLYLQKHRSLL